jgi:large subunit ribosomal protein L19
VNAPVVSKVELVKSAHVRQSRLYFLRSISGKAARLKERRRHVRK